MGNVGSAGIQLQVRFLCTSELHRKQLFSTVRTEI